MSKYIQIVHVHTKLADLFKFAWVTCLDTLDRQTMTDSFSATTNGNKLVFLFITFLLSVAFISC